VIHVAVDPSQFPDRVRADLLAGLQRREIPHKFHYDTYKQAEKWLRLHEAHSPARTDPRCLEVYDRAFDWVAARLSNTRVHLIGLGCGGGQKDTALLQHLKAARATSIYSAVDVSLPLVITARLRAATVTESTTGLVCDLETAGDVRDALCECGADSRVITFFGMVPNSEPHVIFPRLRNLAARGDVLLISANLAPGQDYRAGVARVLPQYDNPETADWLRTFLHDLGVEHGDGEIGFGIEECASGLLRIRADYRFARDRKLGVSGDVMHFGAGEKLRLFYSYRYTPERLRSVLKEYGFEIREQWIAASGEEGVFAVQG
jgi:uncharacterized SAM-dependent methyltransferase